MKIVIDISEETYNEVCWRGLQLCPRCDEELVNAIKNGTPLPENHGRLGDLDAVMSDISTSIDSMTNIGMMVDGEYLWAKLNDVIYNAPTIIEAESEEEE